jgi:hypothetical protein
MNTKFNDIELMYEGSVLVNPSLNAAVKTRVDYQFQGTLAFRRDGAAHAEIFVDKTVFGGNLIINRYCTLNNKMHEQVVDPDDANASPGYAESAGGAASFNRAASYFRIFMLPSLSFSHHFYVDNMCSILGWEQVAGISCLKVDFSQGKAINRYWLDLNRGGNPLKVESLIGDQLRYRVDEIELKSHIMPDGSGLWIPISGMVRTYLNNDLQSTSDPVFTESYKVLDGSVVINQDLGDRRFSPRWTSAHNPNTHRRTASVPSGRAREKIDVNSIDRR